MKAFTSLAATLLCSSAVMAHFTLDYPTSRGFLDAAEGTASCGGFDALTNRTQFPLSNGFLEIDSHHPSATIQINVVLSSSPSTADFTTAGSSPVNSTSLNHPGDACLALNLSSLKGAANNVNATIQVIYNGGDGSLYQCADVVLVTNATGFDQSKCVNNNGASPSASGSAPAPTNAGVVSTPTQGAALAVLTFFVAMMSF